MENLSLFLIEGGKAALMIKGDVAEADVAIFHRTVAVMTLNSVHVSLVFFNSVPSSPGDRHIYIKDLIISLSLFTTGNILKSTTLIVRSSTI